MQMEKKYSVQFFTSLIETLHDACQKHLDYNQFVEVSGYVCVEIDNMKKERYVLSELLQSSGNVVSESYCTKAFRTSQKFRYLTENNSQNYSNKTTQTDTKGGEKEKSQPQRKRQTSIHNEPQDHDQTKRLRLSTESPDVCVLEESHLVQIQQRSRCSDEPQCSSPMPNHPAHSQKETFSTELNSEPQGPPVTQSPKIFHSASESPPRPAPSPIVQSKTISYSAVPSPQPTVDQNKGMIYIKLANQQLLPLSPEDQRKVLVFSTLLSPRQIPPAPTQNKRVGSSTLPSPHQSPPSPVASSQFPCSAWDNMVVQASQLPLPVQALNEDLEWMSQGVTQEQEPDVEVKSKDSGVASEVEVRSKDRGVVSEVEVRSEDRGVVSEVEVRSEDRGVVSEVEVGSEDRDVVSEVEVIDLDLYEDEMNEIVEMEESQSEHSSSVQEDSSDLSQESASVLPQPYKQDAGFSQELETFLHRDDTSLSPGTLILVKSGLIQFMKYHCDKISKFRDIFSLSPEKLEELLLDFFQGVKKVNGGELAPISLKNVQKSIDLVLRHGKYPCSILKDNQFLASRNFIKKKMETNCAAPTIKYVPIDDNDIEILFQKDIFGHKNPDVIIKSMWFVNSKFFGLRRPMEHFTFKWGEILLQIDEFGKEYLERCGVKDFSLKLFAEPENPRCFVRIYKQYKDSRPADMLGPDSPFYLVPDKKAGTVPLFLKEALPWSRFSHMWRNLLQSAGLPFNKKIF